MNSKNKISNGTCLWGLLIGFMILRLLFIGAYPLADTTEARYGEMGRLMVETGDWITPQFEKGIPFWGKPPLSFWLTAVSFQFLGINEFSARLPSFFLGVAVLIMVFSLGRYQTGRKSALIACVILASSIIFWISSGAVMTDNCLLTGTSLSMVAFWRCITDKKSTGRIWGWLFFIGLSIGLMAKGPVAAVLIFLPVLFWALVHQKLKQIMKLPWVSGLILTIVLTLPWYVAAEIKTPGFLEYFIIGEHWNRFLVPGWKGDLYGSAHSQPKGMIWVFWIACVFPWSILPFILLKKETRKGMAKKIRGSVEWYTYLVLWAVSPLVFFTMAGNILWAYVLPGIPAFGLLIAEISRGHSMVEKGIRRTSIVLLSLFFLVSVLVALGVGVDRNSQKKMISYFNEVSNQGKLHYYHWRPFSAEFYTRAAAGEIVSISGLTDLFQDNDKDFLAVKEDHVSRIPAEMISKFNEKKVINGYVLYKEK